jgi:hypothetical protein
MNAEEVIARETLVVIPDTALALLAPCAKYDPF